MEPTFLDGQVRMVNLLSFWGKPPQRGDIVAIRFSTPDQVMIKRVLGLPGERFAIHTGVVFINGNQLEEPYLASPGAWEWPEETLDNGTYFVAGDNREISQQFKVDRRQIFGKLMTISH